MNKIDSACFPHRRTNVFHPGEKNRHEKKFSSTQGAKCEDI